MENVSKVTKYNCIFEVDVHHTIVDNCPETDRNTNAEKERNSPRKGLKDGEQKRDRPRKDKEETRTRDQKRDRPRQDKEDTDRRKVKDKKKQGKILIAEPDLACAGRGKEGAGVYSLSSI